MPPCRAASRDERSRLGCGTGAGHVRQLRNLRRRRQQIARARPHRPRLGSHHNRRPDNHFRRHRRPRRCPQAKRKQPPARHVEHPGQAEVAGSLPGHTHRGRPPRRRRHHWLLERGPQTHDTAACHSRLPGVATRDTRAEPQLDRVWPIALPSQRRADRGATADQQRSDDRRAGPPKLPCTPAKLSEV